MIEELQKAMLQMPQAKIETKHTFCNGVYAREIFIPKDVCLVGAKHKTEFFMVISKGRCIIKDGDREKICYAPHTAISKVGAKRVIYAIEDTILTTFHPTKKTDVKEIELDIIENEGLKIANNPIDDHEKFKIEYGITQELENKVMSVWVDVDLSPIPNIKVKDSKIEGKGCFTTKHIKTKEKIGVCRSDAGMRTILGRFTNHSNSPNAKPVLSDKKITLIAERDIKPHEEILVNYRDMVDINSDLKRVL